MVLGQNQVMPYSDSKERFKSVDRQGVMSEAWKRSLKQSEKDLTTIIEGTESEFLFIGENLRDFHTRAISISDLSSAITGLLSGDEIVRAIGDLKELLRNITAYHDLFSAITQTRMEQLDKILKRILSISEPLSDFRDITKTLRTLCTTTKIQSALIGNAARGFTFLADDVKDLSTRIDARADNITNDLKVLDTMARQTYAKLHMFEARQKEKVSVILKNTDAAISSLSEKYNLSKIAAEDVLSKTSGITLNVGDIVTSAQYHDITRQRFEQIRKVIRDIYARADREREKPLPGDASTPAREGTPEAEFGNMLVAGLSITVKEFSSAVNKIISSLIGIWKNIAGVLREIEMITRDRESGHRTYIAEVEHCLSAVTSAILSLSESAEADRELSAAIRSLSGTTGEISQFIKDINKIGEGLTLISWNSNIKAEEIGKTGASLSVVADFIKKLADDSQAKASDVAGALESVTNAIRGLSFTGSGRSVIEESDMKQMTANMDQMIAFFQAVNGRLLSFLHEIESRGSELAGHIEKVAKNIDVHHTVERIVREVISQLEVLPFPAGFRRDHSLAGPLLIEGTPEKALSGNDYRKGDERSHGNVELF